MTLKKALTFYTKASKTEKHGCLLLKRMTLTNTLAPWDNVWHWHTLSYRYWKHASLSHQDTQAYFTNASDSDKHGGLLCQGIK